MISDAVYSIPLELFDNYRGRPVIVRTTDPGQLVETISEEESASIYYVQVLALTADLDVFATWAVGVPIDFVIADPETEFARLYEFAKLLEKRPVRVTIPVGPGCAKAAKIAGSIGIPVKLSVDQPDAESILEMLSALEMFLHQPTQTQPIEFFTSSLLNFLNDDDVTIWSIQEQDPSRFQFVSDDGHVTNHTRQGMSVDSVDEYFETLVADGAECLTCPFANHCKGYFKLPDPDYVCEGGVKEVFRRLKDAAAELRLDLSKFAATAEASSL